MGIINSEKHTLPCPHCGRDVLDHMKVCPFCKKEITWPWSKKSIPENVVKTSRRLLYFIGFLVLIVLLILKLKS